MEEGRETLGVKLRNFELRDVDDFMVWASDEEVTRLCMWETYRSREVAENYIQKTAMVHPWYKAICVGDRAVGAISLDRSADTTSCRAEIGYVVARRWWGKGVASQAVHLALSTAFVDMPGLERVEGLVEPHNLASQRVLEKAGFVKEGLLRKYRRAKGRTRDLYIYRFLDTDLRQST
ncbi:hypothetical protein SUGI_1145070 [Cryptomeria japonica]|uniref:uncharacterized protein LOC131069675 n=1 Tax=Cryptomeria japonica TaxID=3369 RepID=UPI002414B201|nr:uncharacterized protein LOC131069675 [Cryptomeria japonica]GLJ53680.1 hypothetical protein SUGI_1145070 [Cryptomeria japonica]